MNVYKRNYLKTAYLKCVYYLCTKKNTVKEVFGHLKRRIFNIYVNHLLYSFLLLMEFYGGSLDYGVIV